MNLLLCLRTVAFWTFRQRIVVISYLCFRTTYRSKLKRSRFRGLLLVPSLEYEWWWDLYELLKRRNPTTLQPCSFICSVARAVESAVCFKNIRTASYSSRRCRPHCQSVIFCPPLPSLHRVQIWTGCRRTYLVLGGMSILWYPNGSVASLNKGIICASTSRGQMRYTVFTRVIHAIA